MGRVSSEKENEKVEERKRKGKNNYEEKKIIEVRVKKVLRRKKIVLRNGKRGNV